MYFHDTNFFKLSILSKIHRVILDYLFCIFFKNIDIEYFFTNKKFKTYLISLYSLILIGIMIYK